MFEGTGKEKMDVVKEEILEPMLRVYSPPGHLRKDAEKIKTAVGEYRDALRFYGRETLKAAWNKVRDEHGYWSWPQIAVIKKACEEFKALTPKAVNSEAKKSTKQKWEIAKEGANKLEFDYCWNFEKTSPIAEQAKREEWWNRKLADWVAENARYQAQAICEVQHGMRPSEHALQYPASKEEREEREQLCNHMRKQATATGKIEVVVPAWFYQKYAPKQEAAA